MYDVNSAKSFETLDSWRDEFLIQASPMTRRTSPSSYTAIKLIWRIASGKYVFEMVYPYVIVYLQAITRVSRSLRSVL